jgi:hypothetical protein
MQESGVLVEERNKWRKEFLESKRVPWLLEEYKKNRDTELWRSTRVVEELCEYILHLESCVKGMVISAPERYSKGFIQDAKEHV